MLIPEAGKWHKLWSIRFLILAGFFAALSEAYPNLPSDWVSGLPTWLKSGLGITGMFFGGCSGIARVIKQAGISNDT